MIKDEIKVISDELGKFQADLITLQNGNYAEQYDNMKSAENVFLERNFLFEIFENVKKNRIEILKDKSIQGEKIKSGVLKDKSIQDVEKEIEGIASRLPDISDIFVDKLRSNTATVEFVRSYAEEYFTFLKNSKNMNKDLTYSNFFQAAAHSHYCIFIGNEFEDRYDSYANELLSLAKLSPNKQSLSIEDVDKIIHNPHFTQSRDSYKIFIILDTALRVILTNLPESLPSLVFIYVLVYDNVSHNFVPIPRITNNFEKEVCPKCLSYELYHDCERHCPICLRKDNDFQCFKPESPESELKKCEFCGVFCQNETCYNEQHSESCNGHRPNQKIHNNIVHLIKSLHVSAS